MLIVDDVLATGGTAKATVDLARRAGGNVIGIGKPGNCKILITQASKGKVKGKKATINVTFG